MSYKALYRKWRPKIFEDVIGQVQVITTLKNQINLSNISHAYLFSGTRGTGKTSTAKIFARAVNCLQPKDANPCNSCEVCEGIMTEKIMDVVEIDAASNNGVDHVREIRENVKYPPSKGKYKVYIIDEVHMLSSGAFNALLKTLEEPPNHVIFILATTEPHKLPATILSRCQRFDFKPVKTKEIVDHLGMICDHMEIQWEEEALKLIALNGEGALRDCLSILEQCISFGQGKLTYDEIINTLGMVSHDFLFQLTDYIADQNTSKVLEFLNQMVMEGKDIQQLTKNLINHFRNLLLIKMEVEVDEVTSLPIEIRERLAIQSEKFSINMISSHIQRLSQAESRLKQTTQPRIIMELTLVELCNIELDQSIEGLLERVARLEEMVASGEIEKKISVNRKTKELDQSIPSFSPQKEKNEDEEEIKEEELIKEEALDFKEIKKNWPEILETMRLEKKAQIQALLKEGNLQDLEGDKLVIAFKEGFGFHREALDKPKTKEYICNVIGRVTGQKVSLSFIMEDQLSIQEEEQQSKDPVAYLKEKLPKDFHHILEVKDE